MHILDIAENSIEAQASTVQIHIEENSRLDIFRLTIADNGRGMTEEQRRRALDPFFTTKTTRRFGLGLSLLAESSRAAAGDFSLRSTPGHGTIMETSFQRSHIDAKPLGDIAGTMITLIVGNPETDFVYSHEIDGCSFSLDTREIKDKLEDVSISNPEIIHFIKDHIKEGIDHIRRQK